MRHLLRLVLLSCAAWSACVSQTVAQTTQEPKRVGFVVYGTSAPRNHLLDAFLDGMREQGYVEGKNLVVERRFAEGSLDRLIQGAGELSALKLDAIVTTCSPSTLAVKTATSGSTTPIVMAVVTDPVGQGLVASLARPGGNVTGRSSQVEDTLPKMLELFAGVLPKSARIAVLHNTNNPVHPLLWREAEKAAKSLDMTLVRIDVAGSNDFPAAFDTIARERLGALLVLPDDGMTMNNRTQLVALAAQRRIATFYGLREFVAQGGLMSYGENYAADYRSTAAYVGKVLRGEKPANLPVEQPTRFEFVINSSAAKALGVTIPASLLVRADEVLQ